MHAEHSIDDTGHQHTTVVIADDHPVFRSGLRDIIERDGRFLVIAEACDGVEALQMIHDLKPRTAIIDIEMPRLNGLEVARQVQQEKLDTMILILTMYQEESIFRRAMECDVAGYLLKDTAAADILQALVVVRDGGYFISPKLSHHVLVRSHEHDAMDDLMQRLTRMERTVLGMIADSKTTPEIADHLCLSPRTVENHRLHICRKLDLTGSHSLLRFVMTHRDAIGMMKNTGHP